MLTAVAQFGPTTDPEANYAAIERLTARAHAGGAELVVFPEESMIVAEGLTRSLADTVHDEWPKFEDRMSRLAALQRIAIVIGGYEPNDTTRPNNTLLAITADGVVAARYRDSGFGDAARRRASRCSGRPAQLLRRPIPRDGTTSDRSRRRIDHHLRSVGSRPSQRRSLGDAGEGPRYREHGMGVRGRQHLG
jgi:hypothetical protein